VGENGYQTAIKGVDIFSEEEIQCGFCVTEDIHSTVRTNVIVRLVLWLK
jgi:hypothetical protein